MLPFHRPTALRPWVGFRSARHLAFHLVTESDGMTKKYFNKASSVFLSSRQKQSVLARDSTNRNDTGLKGGHTKCSLSSADLYGRTAIFHFFKTMNGNLC